MNTKVIALALGAIAVLGTLFGGISLLPDVLNQKAAPTATVRTARASATPAATDTPTPSPTPSPTPLANLTIKPSFLAIKAQTAPTNWACTLQWVNNPCVIGARWPEAILTPEQIKAQWERYSVVMGIDVRSIDFTDPITLTGKLNVGWYKSLASNGWWSAVDVTDRQGYVIGLTNVKGVSYQLVLLADNGDPVLVLSAATSSFNLPIARVLSIPVSQPVTVTAALGAKVYLNNGEVTLGWVQGLLGPNFQAWSNGRVDSVPTNLVFAAVMGWLDCGQRTRYPPEWGVMDASLINPYLPPWLLSYVPPANCKMLWLKYPLPTQAELRIVVPNFAADGITPWPDSATLLRSGKVAIGLERTLGQGGLGCGNPVIIFPLPGATPTPTVIGTLTSLTPTPSSTPGGPGNTLTPTSTPIGGATPTPTVPGNTPTNTPASTSTPPAATNTPAPTATLPAATPTNAPTNAPTATTVPPTATQPAPTSTRVPPTSTPIPPTVPAPTPVPTCCVYVPTSTPPPIQTPTTQPTAQPPATATFAPTAVATKPPTPSQPTPTPFR